MGRNKRRTVAPLHLFALVMVLGVASVMIARRERTGEAIAASSTTAPAAAPSLVAVAGNLPPVSADQVLVICNTADEDSQAIAEQYRLRRGVPAKNLLRVVCTTGDEITRAEYLTAIEPFVRARAESDPKINYVVLTRGVPFRFADYGEVGGYSVDGVLATCLMESPPKQKAPNPYFGANTRFRRKAFGNLLLVTRLDGPDPADAMRQIESAQSARPVSGPFYLRDSFCMDMSAGDAVLKSRSLDADYVTPANNPLAPDYQGHRGPYMAHWGAGPHDTQYSDAEFAALRFLPGGICDLTWSCGAMHLRNAAAQANIAMLTRNGAAGVHGFVSEPFCDAVSRSEIVLDRYLRGYTIAESFSMGSPYLHWKDVVLGDPLCAPYADAANASAVGDRSDGKRREALTGVLRRPGDRAALASALSSNKRPL